VIASAFQEFRPQEDGVLDDRDPHIGGKEELGSAKGRRGDSDDGERVFVDRDGAANDGRVAVEVAVPVCIAEDDVRGAVFTLLVGGMKESAEVRLDIEGIEVVAAGHVRPGDGWVRTGDKYLRRASGHLVYCGRRDDLLKVGGIYVSPMEVENALLAHPAVIEVAVVGAQDADKLIKPKAIVVARSPSPALADELIAHVRGRLADYKRPRWIEFVDSLPKTATGKVQRYKLR